MKIFKLILMLSALVTSLMAAAVEPHVSYYDMTDLEPGMAFRIDEKSASMVIEARVALTGSTGSRAGKNCSWGIAWNCSEVGYEYIKLRQDDKPTRAVDEQVAIEIVRGVVRSERDSVVKIAAIKKGLSPLQQPNTLAVEWKEGEMWVYAGNRVLDLVARYDGAKFPDAAMECRLLVEEPFTLESLVTECTADMKALAAPELDDDSFATAMAAAAADENAGIWEYMDRETDDSRARAGGRYTLALLPEDAGGAYTLLYIGGATVNGPSWQRYMKKGRLVPTAFEGQYTLEWIDSMFEPVENCDTYATIEGGRLLTLYFPMYRSQIRLSKR